MNEAYSLRFKTLVFMDLESTSVVPEELPKNINITEMSFVAIHVDRFNEKLRPPRVLNKLTMCIQPKTLVSLTAMQMTNLDNGNLEKQQRFGPSTAFLLKQFLGQLEAPICLLAHNGSRFDFPLLKAELYAVDTTLQDYIYVMDTLTACKRLIGATFESRYIDDEYISEEEDQNKPSTSASVTNGANNGHQVDTNGGLSREPIKEIDGFGPQTQAGVFEIIEETLNKGFINGASALISPARKRVALSPPSTPKKIKKRLVFGTPKKRRIIDFGEQQYWPKDVQGLSLGNVYKKVLGEEMKSAHEAEADVLNLLKVCRNLDGFIEFIEYNAKPFKDDFFVKPLWYRK